MASLDLSFEKYHHLLIKKDVARLVQHTFNTFRPLASVSKRILFLY